MVITGIRERQNLRQIKMQLQNQKKMQIRYKERKKKGEEAETEQPRINRASVIQVISCVVRGKYVPMTFIEARRSVGADSSKKGHQGRTGSGGQGYGGGDKPLLTGKSLGRTLHVGLQGIEIQQPSLVTY